MRDGLLSFCLGGREITKYGLLSFPPLLGGSLVTMTGRLHFGAEAYADLTPKASFQPKKRILITYME